ncbi:MAG: hypothetical protein HYR80_03950 [Nitrospirae bacterium]|nr:hypothetical protein [Nitrospirota bacterium]
MIRRSLRILIAFVISASWFLLPEGLWAYESILVEKGGTVSGTIKLKGELPALQPHKVIHNPEYCGDTIPDETYLVNPTNHGLQMSAVSIEGVTRGKRHDSTTIILNNLKCRFQPHTLAGMVGDFYEVRNSDPILHNTHLKMDDLTLLNVAMPANGKNIKKPLNQAGTIAIKCDAHSFMTGDILVFDHPYFAVTDDAGFYKISDIPPGKYKIKFWQNGLAVKEKELTIAPNEKINLSVELAAK